MTNTNLTNRKALEYAICLINNDDSMCAMYDPDEVIAKLEAMITALDKKAQNRKPTAQQEQNEKFKEMIINFLTECGECKTVTEIQLAIPDLNPAQVTNQRAGAIIRELVKAGTLVRTVEKRKAYFGIA